MSLSSDHWNSNGKELCPLVADLFLYSYESKSLDKMIRGRNRRLARSLNLCYGYIDDSIIFNKKKGGDYVAEIYPSKLTVEKANRSDDLAKYLDLTFITESNNSLTPSSMTNVIILILTLSIFHSFRVLSRRHLPIVHIFRSR